MKYKILVEGPALTQSGYGEHTRLVLRALRTRADILDVYLSALNWGSTNWLLGDSDERVWIDTLLHKAAGLKEEDRVFDIHIHVGIPNEFQRKAPYAVMVTAGIETTKVAPKWIQNSYNMDKLIVPSEFSKWVFENTKYAGTDQDGLERTAGCGAPVEVVPYPVQTLEKDENFNINLDYNFNFLTIAQWSIRKNLENTIRWFIEEFKNEEVGLVIKTNTAKNCYMDRQFTKDKLKAFLSKKEFRDRKCKIYFIHGDMTREELNSLYTHPKIKAFVSATHGEGYGLPLFEAASNGLPVLAPGWSGHLDFLYAPVKDKKGKEKRKPLFARTDYILAPVQKEAEWNDIVVKDSMWCYPNKVDHKRKMRQLYKNHSMYLSWAKKLRKHILENYTEKKVTEKMLEELLPGGILVQPELVFVSDLFQAQYAGGAEMSLQAIMEKSPKKTATAAVNSQYLGAELLEANKDIKWIFGNISEMKDEVFAKIQELNIDYSFIEFDYKFCKHRNPLLYEMVEGEACNYSETALGKKLETFMNNANSVFFMSKKQLDIHRNSLPGLNNDRLFVLSSLFDDDFFEKIEFLRSKHKSERNNKWLVMGSDSWVKGAQESEQWCKDNNKEYEVLWNVPPAEFLERLSSFRGVCFKPSGLDTCPRLVIEAKLLGCEVELNGNIQHTQEEWFNLEYDGIVGYLKSRRQFFWERAFER